MNQADQLRIMEDQVSMYLRNMADSLALDLVDATVEVTLESGKRFRFRSVVNQCDATMDVQDAE